MAFAIRGPTPPPLMAKFPDIFLPHFFSFAIESYIYETDFTLKNITFKSSYNWFIIDIHQQLMANAILNFHFDYWHTSLIMKHDVQPAFFRSVNLDEV